MCQHPSRKTFIVLLSVVATTLAAVTTPPTEDFDHSGDYVPEEIVEHRHPAYITIKFDETGNTLQSNINEFIELIPVTEVKKKLMEYYRNDRDVQQIYDYANGKDFLAMKKRLLDVREIKDFQQYLNAVGLNIKEILHKLDTLLGISKMKPPPNRNACENTFSFCTLLCVRGA